MKDWLIPVLGAALLALLPLMVEPYTQDLAVKMMVFAIFALSLELLVGMTGLVSLGHAAFFGIGAYVTVLASPEYDPGSVAMLLPMAVLAAAAYALIVGLLSLRTKGAYFIMVTLAFAQMAYFVFHDTRLGVSSDGIFLNVRPVQGSWLDLDDKRHLFYFVLACLVFTYSLLALVRRSRFGHALAGIRVNEQRMRAVGFHTFGYKLAAFTLAGALAGLAGFLLAAKDAAVNPALLSWHESSAVLLMITLGGLGHLRGAVLGTVVFTLLKEVFSTHSLVGPLADHWQLTLGVTVIAFVALLPHGLMGLPQWLRSRR